MPSPVVVAVIVGSFRKGSYTRKIARAIIQLAPQSLRCREVEIRQLEMYNEDLRPHTSGILETLYTGLSQERARCEVAPAGRHRQRDALSDGRHGRESRRAPSAGVPQHAGRKTRKFLADFMVTFERWIASVTKSSSSQSS
ncbi:MAG TPA: NAD(P)H-dependent oxidoreductase [Steroidobacteraceae bacterium]|nr:NAD(P)H-dependent oxidoreductase [Steroidobacteraceae bacterium]